MLLSAPNLTRYWLFFRGRNALYALLKAAGIRSGDEVLLQAFTCQAVPAPILALGAKPVYVDIDRSLCADPKSLGRQVTDRTKAVVVQHTYGFPADLRAISGQLQDDQLIIEDCCHSLGSLFESKELGTLGHAAFWSYEWGKPIVAGLGGAAFVHSKELRDRVGEELRKDGWRNPSFAQTALVHSQYFAHSFVGSGRSYWLAKAAYAKLSGTSLLGGTGNLDVSEDDAYYRVLMPASIKHRLSRMVSGLTEERDRRRADASYLFDRLASLGVNTDPHASNDSWTPMRLPLWTTNKSEALELARKRRVEVGDWYVTPVDPLEGKSLEAVGYSAGSCPVAEDASASIVTLPVRGLRPVQLEPFIDFVSELVTSGLLRG